MRIEEQKNSLSEEDLEWLRGTATIEKMLKLRLVVEFDTNPDIEEIDFSALLETVANQAGLKLVSEGKDVKTGLETKED